MPVPTWVSIVGASTGVPASDGRSLEATILLAREQAPSGARVIVISSRRPQIAADEEHDNLAWIDVSQPGLETLFTLE